MNCSRHTFGAAGKITPIIGAGTGAEFPRLASLKDPPTTDELLQYAWDATPYQTTLDTTRTPIKVANLPSARVLERRSMPGTRTPRNSAGSSFLAHTSLMNTHIWKSASWRSQRYAGSNSAIAGLPDRGSATLYGRFEALVGSLHLPLLCCAAHRRAASRLPAVEWGDGASATGETA